MRNRVRIHPALKHGAYAASAVLPGESRAAFEKLHRDLIAELSPNGALEEDAVASIARLVWRKQNLQTLRIAERARGHSLKIRNEKLNAEVMRALIEDYDELQEEKRAGEDQAREEFGESYKLVELDHATLGGLTEDLGFQERLD